MANIILLIFVTVLSTSSAVKYLGNVDCGAYIDYVATDPEYHQFRPYYVRLHRCHGKNVGINPHNKKCLPVADKINEIEIFGELGVAADMSTKKVYNHTVCSERCILESSSCSPYELYQPNDCACLCNYTSARPPPNGTCQTPFYWNQEKCDCKCKYNSLTCEKKKIFSAESCGCVCKDKFRVQCANRKEYLDESTCGCVPAVITGATRGGCEGDVKGGILAVVMILEALAFLVAYFFIYSYWYKRKYLPRKKEKKITSMYSTNGDVGTHNRPANEFNTISLEEDEENYSINAVADDKDLIKEEEHAREKEDLLNRPVYYLDNEKSPLASKQDEEWYMYNDIMEVDGPSNNDSSGSTRLAPPEYSDYVSSELSEDGYASVTQV